jgi:hypothetical protein
VLSGPRELDSIGETRSAAKACWQRRTCIRGPVCRRMQTWPAGLENLPPAARRGFGQSSELSSVTNIDTPPLTAECLFGSLMPPVGYCSTKRSIVARPKRDTTLISTRPFGKTPRRSSPAVWSRQRGTPFLSHASADDRLGRHLPPANPPAGLRCQVSTGHGSKCRSPISFQLRHWPGPHAVVIRRARFRIFRPLLT